MIGGYRFDKEQYDTTVLRLRKLYLGKITRWLIGSTLGQKLSGARGLAIYRAKKRKDRFKNHCKSPVDQSRRYY